MIYLLILLILLSAATFALVSILLKRFNEHMRIQEHRLLRMERLVNDLFQEKTVSLVRQMQGRIRIEHETHREALDEPGEGWDEVEDLFREEDKTFSTALRILIEARRMYEERMKLIDRLG